MIESRTVNVSHIQEYIIHIMLLLFCRFLLCRSQDELAHDTNDAFLL